MISVTWRNSTLLIPSQHLEVLFYVVLIYLSVIFNMKSVLDWNIFISQNKHPSWLISRFLTDGGIAVGYWQNPTRFLKKLLGLTLYLLEKSLLTISCSSILVWYRYFLEFFWSFVTSIFFESMPKCYFKNTDSSPLSDRRI